METAQLKCSRVERLKDELLSGKINALEEFWEDIKKSGAPLIDDIEGDTNNVLVTVIWRDCGDINSIAVFGELFGTNTEETLLNRIPDTDVYYRTFSAPRGSRSLYVFFINELLGMDFEEIDIRIDPLNPKTYTCIEDNLFPSQYYNLVKVESLIELPGFTGCPYAKGIEDTKSSHITEHIFQSNVLNAKRRVWTYCPEACKNGIKPKDLVIFTDGWEYVNAAGAPEILDNMINAGAIPPVYAVFIDSKENRTEEIGINPRYIDFLVKEMLPWTHDIFSIKNQPLNHVMAGFSRGGLTAAYAALEHPQIFSKVLSQSGAFYFEFEGCGEWVVKQYEKASVLPSDFYMSTGVFERCFTFHVDATSKLHNILSDKGCHVLWEEFPGGHTNYDCQFTLAKGLIHLIGIK